MITLLTSGSRGDIQPFVALGAALRQAGQSVRVTAFEAYGDLVRGAGLELFPIRGNITAAVASEAGLEAMQADNPLKMALNFRKLRDLAAGLYVDFLGACEGSDAIVYHPGAAIGYFIAQQMGIPAVLGLPFPMVETSAYPAILFYHLPRLGAATNRLTHRLTQQMLWLASKDRVRLHWLEQYGQLPEGYGSPYPKQVTRRNPTLISCSHHVFPRPADWSEHVHMPGYWFLDDLGDWQPPADLLKFLDAGDPPIYVGFGSMGDPAKAAATTELVVSALQATGKRGLLATGWHGMVATGRLPEGMFVLESAPHSWLFPRTGAVVHHGGAGTTAAGLRAGVPSVLTPYGLDQLAWGRRVWELGVGPRPVARKRLTATRLAEAIDVAYQPSVREKAARLGELIRREEGAETAAQIILASLKA